MDYAAAAAALLQIAFQLYQDYEASHTGENIPSWDEISNKNALLQAKIDQEPK